jgi:hypothetical protein
MRWMAVLLPIAFVGGWVFAEVEPELASALIPWGFLVGAVLFALGVVLERLQAA